MTLALVTGAAGFIGSHLTKSLQKQGIDVLCVDNLSGGFKENLNKDTILHKGDIQDYPFLEYLFEHNKIDYVYHLAAYAAEGLSPFIARFNYNNNLIASVNLINLAVLYHIKCFVFTSSIAVYSEGQVPFTEETIPSPSDPYGIAKYAVELHLRNAHHMFGLDSIIFRPHNVYGPNQSIGDKYRNVIGIFMNQILRNEPITIFGDGNQERAFTYIDDVAPILAKSVEYKNAYNQIFNIGADTYYNINGLIHNIAEKMNATPEIKHLPARQEVVKAYSDHTKLRQYFPVPEPTSLSVGLDKMISWCYSNGSRETKKFTNIEITENLPESWK
jgi:UDP-glucose 4-epimerase